MTDEQRARNAERIREKKLAQLRIEEIEAEIDRRTHMPGDYRYWEGRYRDEKAHAETLTRERDALREALQPFAQAADDAIDETDQDEWEAWEHPCAMAIKIGDFRKARAALTNKGQDNE